MAALFDMATEDGRAADLDGAHHPLLLERDGVVLAKFLAMASKDVGQLDGWPGHASGLGSLGLGQDGAPAARQDPVQWAGDLGNGLGGHGGVVRGGVDAPVSQHDLDFAEVDAIFQQMSG